MKTMKNFTATMLMSILVTVTFTACSENYLDYDVEAQPEAITPTLCGNSVSREL